jgi:membrane protein
MKKFIKGIVPVAKETIAGMGRHDLMSSAAAIAYYTIFSLPGLLITIVMVAGIFLGQEAVKGELSSQIDGLMGSSAADTIEAILTNIELTDSGIIGSAIGIGTLLFSATTVFMTLQSALNTTWEVKAKPKKGWLKYLINRMLSLGMIISMGFILVVSLLADTLLKLLMTELEAVLGSTSAHILELAGFIITAGVMILLCALIFKMLPDVKLRWKQVWMGAVITAGMFILGKFLIGFYLGQSDFSATYETAGSVILILVWVYYSTVIILFGAEITRAIVIYNGGLIEPSDAAVKIKLEEMEVVDGKYVLHQDSELEACDISKEDVIKE